MSINEVKLKRRTQSLIEDYEQNKKKLPFIKPRYIKEDMFSRIDFNNNQHTLRNRQSPEIEKIEIHPTAQTSPKRVKAQSQTQIVRFKIKHFHRNRLEGKIKLEAIDRNNDNQEGRDLSEESIINKSCLKRIVKHRKIATEIKEEVAPSNEEIINKSQLLYTPVLINRGFTHKDSFIYSSKKGKIKRQSFKRLLQNAQFQSEILKARQDKQILLKRFRKVGNALLFIIYLKRYNKNFQARRKRYIDYTGSENVKDKFVELKLFLLQKCTPLLEGLSMKYEDLYQIHEKDTTEVRAKKISTLGRLLNILLDCISKGLDDMKGRTSFIEIIYSICKHGSYSCLWDFHTPQQLDISCVSQETGYLCADSHLEQSYLIGLVFVKIIVYNLLLNPESLNFPVSPLYDKAKIYVNMKILGNIFYQLLISLQDKYLELADNRFTIGNWRNLTYKFDIQTAESMTVKKGLFQKNELISGLYGHTFIRETYQINELTSELKIIEELIIKTHILIKEYHERIRKNCM